MKTKRPIDLPLSHVIEINSKNPIAMASILHRVSGIVLFLLTPVLLYVADVSLSSQAGFEAVFANVGLRFVVWIFVAALAYHFVMGCKHLLADMGKNEEIKSGKTAAVVSFVIAFVLILASFVWVMF